MAEAQNDSGQSMDDILASIRRIISDEPTPQSDAADNSGTEVIGAGGNVGAKEGEQGAVPGQKQPDDLSDILEPGSGNADTSGVGVASSPETVVGRGGTAPGSTPWPFDREGAPKSTAGSLKNKLASLDGAAH